MIRRPPRSTLSSSSAASDVYKRQEQTLRWQAKKFRLRRPPRRADSTHSPEQFLPVPDVVAEHERREIGGGGVVRPAPRDLRERVDEVHERGVRRDHERRELDAVAPQLLGLFERAVHDLQVEAERVLVEAPALVAARRLAVRDHENLAVARAAPHETLSPDFVFVWNGPTCALLSSSRGTGLASSPKSTMSIVSFGYFWRISSVSASATFFAGVKRSSP